MGEGRSKVRNDQLVKSGVNLKEMEGSIRSVRRLRSTVRWPGRRVEQREAISRRSKAKQKVARIERESAGERQGMRETTQPGASGGHSGRSAGGNRKPYGPLLDPPRDPLKPSSAGGRVRSYWTAQRFQVKASTRRTCVWLQGLPRRVVCPCSLSLSAIACCVRPSCRHSRMAGSRSA
jgi:hypothetical protein